ncbi:DUF992 domain-containing protein [Bradyrhizobium sp. 41S5]|uniref:DUF992 domain-containing protein n=1 Tax=Bradyrhizobium sp. 41S5 TaxID=1404443 RepID=UPI0035301471
MLRLTLVALLSITALPAHAEAFRAGRLVCASTPRVGLVLGSAQQLRCLFLLEEHVLAIPLRGTD